MNKSSAVVLRREVVTRHKGGQGRGAAIPAVEFSNRSCLGPLAGRVSISNPAAPKYRT